MKEQFDKYLQQDEEILFHGFFDVSKTSKQYGRLILAFSVMSLFWVITIIGIKSDGLIDFAFLIILIVLVILTICLLYGFIYNTFLKYKKKNYQYFVTNKRIALFNPEKGFRIENISDIEHVSIAREKDNYGDVTFNFYSNSFYEQLTNWMSFEGVENPRKIVELISLLNKNINFYDDRPVIMGKKI